MKTHAFGRLWSVSTLTLGGGGLGMLWGPTTFDECVATVHDAVAAGINLLDLAPRYGDGKAEEVVGEAFGGRLPEGVRVTSKCNVGEPLAYQIEDIVRHSIDDSLKRLRLSRLDLFFLHSNVVPDAVHIAARPDAAARMTLYSTFVEHVRPAFEKLIGEGIIGAWGLTGIGYPDTIIKLLGESPAPAAVQCIANLLDSPGGLKFFDGPAKPRNVMAAARNTMSASWASERCRPARSPVRLTGLCRQTIRRCEIMSARPDFAGSPPNWATTPPCWRTVTRYRSPSIRSFWASKIAKSSQPASPRPKPGPCRRS
jgi:hypothetical protein